jgi:hypothetical protein
MPFLRKKSEVFLTSFGAHVPGVPEQLQEQNVYPIATRTSNGFDLDYSSLMVVDGLILDRHALEFINNNRRPHFGEMRKSIDFLLDKELIRVADYRAIALKHSEEIANCGNSLLECPEFWLSTARKHWATYRQELPEVIRRLGSRIDSESESMHFGIYCMLKRGVIKATEAVSLHNLLQARRTRLSPPSIVSVQKVETINGEASRWR